MKRRLELHTHARARAGVARNTTETSAVEGLREELEKKEQRKEPVATDDSMIHKITTPAGVSGSKQGPNITHRSCLKSSPLLRTPEGRHRRLPIKHDRISAAFIWLLNCRNHPNCQETPAPDSPAIISPAGPRRYEMMPGIMCHSQPEVSSEADFST